MEEDQARPSNLLLKIWTALVVAAIVFPPVQTVALPGGGTSLGMGPVFEGFEFIGDISGGREIALPLLVFEIAVVSLVCFVWWKFGDN